MTRSAELVAAMRGADPSAPEALAIFDRIAGASDPAPDFLEWSARLDGGCDAARLTYYFDVEGRPARARAALTRLGTLAPALGAELPSPLSEALTAGVPGARHVRQVVLGLDARKRRVKAYLVLSGDEGDLVDALLRAAAVDRPAASDPSRVYIVGFDLDAGGVTDAKLYYRLELARLHRAVSNLRDFPDLLSAAREVVWQRGLTTGRAQVYFHARGAAELARYLARRARWDPAVAALGSVRARVASQLSGTRLEPRIVSLPLKGGRLERAGGNVYVHLGAGPRAGEASGEGDP